jgi:predicted Zn-dependent protease
MIPENLGELLSISAQKCYRKNPKTPVQRRGKCERADYMKIKTINVIALILVFTNISCNTASRDIRYDSAMKEIELGNMDFAFMELRGYLRENPGSIHAPQIKFAACEYYFLASDYRDAISELTQYITGYPFEKNTIFAQAILYKILLEHKGDTAVLEKLKELFFSKSVFLIFSESKTKQYKSILNNNYRIMDYVDKIEIFKNDELFLKITP